jgi:hypothetical protein
MGAAFDVDAETIGVVGAVAAVEVGLEVTAGVAHAVARALVANRSNLFTVRRSSRRTR